MVANEKGIQIKQVIVMRKDLRMRRGKEIAQGAHAAMAFLTKRLRERYVYDSYEPLARIKDSYILELNPDEAAWTRQHFTKVCLQCNSEKELLDIAEQAKAAGIECHIIEDEGVTEFGGVLTKTCLALGPDDSREIAKITGHLSLY